MLAEKLINLNKSKSVWKRYILNLSATSLAGGGSGLKFNELRDSDMAADLGHVSTATSDRLNSQPPRASLYAICAPVFPTVQRHVGYVNWDLLNCP